MSLVPVLMSPKDPLRSVVLIENGGGRRSTRTESTLLTWHGAGKRGELYDLDDDPDCMFNLWDNPEAASMQAGLLDMLIELMASNQDPLPPRVGVW